MTRKPLRLYLDTSVYGGVFEDEFREDSAKIFEAYEQKKCVILVSEIVSAEIDRAPRHIRDFAKNISRDRIEEVSLNDEVRDLQQAYLHRKILTSRSANDAAHVALATTARADAIVSWNFKDIVRLDKMKLYKQVNVELGYGILLQIVSPKEVAFDE